MCKLGGGGRGRRKESSGTPSVRRVLLIIFNPSVRPELGERNRGARMGP